MQYYSQETKEVLKCSVVVCIKHTATKLPKKCLPYHLRHKGVTAYHFHTFRVSYDIKERQKFGTKAQPQLL